MSSEISPKLVFWPALTMAADAPGLAAMRHRTLQRPVAMAGQRGPV